MRSAALLASASASAALRAEVSSLSAVGSGPAARRSSAAARSRIVARVSEAESRFISSSASSVSTSAGTPSAGSISMRPTRRWFRSTDWRALRSPVVKRAGVALLDFEAASVFARGPLGGEGPLQLADDLRLAIGEPGFELVGRDDRDAARRDRAADAGPVVGRLGFERQLRADGQVHRGDVERVFDDATVAVSTVVLLLSAATFSGPRKSSIRSCLVVHWRSASFAGLWDAR